MVNHRFVFHLSRCLRAAARAFALTFFAMSNPSVVLRGLPHLQVADKHPLFEGASCSGILTETENSATS